MDLAENGVYPPNVHFKMMIKYRIWGYPILRHTNIAKNKSPQLPNKGLERATSVLPCDIILAVPYDEEITRMGSFFQIWMVKIVCTQNWMVSENDPKNWMVLSEIWQNCPVGIFVFLITLENGAESHWFWVWGPRSFRCQSHTQAQPGNFGDFVFEHHHLS